MKDKLRALALNPYAYVIAFNILGAGAVVTGIAMLAGAGWALVAAGSFAIAAANYITKGLKPNA